MEVIIALLVAATVAVLVYNLRPLPADHFTERVEAAYSQTQDQSLPFYRGLLASFGPLVKYTPLGWLRAVERQLYWAQLAGKWPGWSLTEIVALHVALCVGGAVVSALIARGSLLNALAIPIALPLVFNILYLRAPSRRTRRQFGAELPEMVAIMAAEVASETTLQEAIARVSRAPGICAAWFRLAQQRGAGKSLFTKGNEPGALLSEALTCGERELITFVRALDNIDKRGTGAKELLGQVARDTASRFIGAAQLRAESVGSELILPMLAFFFVPYLVVILAVMAGPVIAGGLF
jgi:Flp pilus assembly protein TadB